MDLWKCSRCKHMNHPSMRECIKRCGGRRPVPAQIQLRDDRTASERAEALAKNSDLYKAILRAKAASRMRFESL